MLVQVRGKLGWVCGGWGLQGCKADSRAKGQRRFERQLNTASCKRVTRFCPHSHHVAPRVSSETAPSRPLTSPMFLSSLTLYSFHIRLSSRSAASLLITLISLSDTRSNSCRRVCVGQVLQTHHGTTAAALLDNKVSRMGQRCLVEIYKQARRQQHGSLLLEAPTLTHK